MTARPRIDLDGVTLEDPAHLEGEPIAILRYRTTDGLILLIPESADFLVPWEGLEEVALDLKTGRVRVTFAADYASARHWLRGATTLQGTWTDRCELDAKSLGL
ncbi:MAG: hypothetical protein JKY65_32110 [Planctomycetes bacterium]|nr:hypothetical protein [Planctomycetota bacterium]